MLFFCRTFTSAMDVWCNWLEAWLRAQDKHQAFDLTSHPNNELRIVNSALTRGQPTATPGQSWCAGHPRHERLANLRGQPQGLSWCFDWTNGRQTEGTIHGCHGNHPDVPINGGLILIHPVQTEDTIYGSYYTWCLDQWIIELYIGET
jgi:hypothetical protein